MSEKRNENYFLYTVLFITSTVVLFFAIDRLFFQSDDLSQLKQEKREYLINLPKEKAIKIGVTWPFFLEEGDNYFKEGILFALKKLNKRKLLGRDIEVVFKDDEWEVETATDIAKEFSNDKDIVAVIAHDDIDLATPASITYEYSGTIMISPAVSHPRFARMDFDYIFRNTPSDVVIGQKLADLAKSLNFKKVVVLNSKDLYSEGLSKVFSERAKENRITIPYNEKFDENEKNFFKILTNISPLSNKTIDYDAVFVAGSEENVVSLIQEARKKGIYAPFLTGDRLDSPKILSMGETADNTIVATIYNSELLYEKTQNFIDDFKEEYAIVPDTWAVQGYDAMMLLAKAIENVNSLDPMLIAKQLKYMSNFESIIGNYSLNEAGDTVDRDVYFKIVKNSQFKYMNVE